ncbi:unnamed protein product [Brassica oleracea var. botrytis]
MSHCDVARLELRFVGYQGLISLPPSSPQASHRDSSCQPKTCSPFHYVYEGELRGRPH